MLQGITPRGVRPRLSSLEFRVLMRSEAAGLIPPPLARHPVYDYQAGPAPPQLHSFHLVDCP